MQYINYRENRKRGTADFPMEYHHVSPNHPQYNMALHWHVEFEFIRILKGSFKIIIDDQTFLAPEDSFIFIPAGALHEGVPHDCEYDCLVFDMNMLMNKNDSCCKFLRKIIDHEVDIPYIHYGSHNDFHQSVWSLFDAIASKKEGYQLTVLGALYQIIGIIFSGKYFNSAPVQQSRSHRKIVQLKQALEFMESSFNHQITLQEMADSVNMSPKYFCRFFQEMTHRTPVDYLNYYRVERACYQLLTTDQSITEVAYNSGFNDLSYFIKTFKKYKGTTPKQYLH